ncbi:G-type lectin S-receptor-like serine/threonine-protein kinase [Gossypium australe]|uniref:Receptor-like serine/threonine-protein kinase n=1 Tax=Gossypium australe TaxID=47621 RepID=A0A5B6W9G3_9ROSI|nr:G-type lectin S-receptor-like serine/threonine-protein kinase [Gossypium australe]
MAVFNLLLVVFPFFCLSITSFAADTIRVNQSIRDGENETLISANGAFELGFFSPQLSSNRYIGIWYKKISPKKVVWVANRNNPINDTNGELLLAEQGNLILMNATKGTVWSTNSPSLATNPTAQLLDTGNLVVQGNGNGNVVWQSFDYPTDTFLPGMKLGINLVTGMNRKLTTWTSINDPSLGDYTFEIDPDGLPEFFLENDSVMVYRTGYWNGITFSGIIFLGPNPVFTIDFVSNEKEIYLIYELKNNSVLYRMGVTPDGTIERFICDDPARGWRPYLNVMTDTCDQYKICGAYGSCNIKNSPVCSCMKGFVPKDTNDWEKADWLHGCVRKVPLSCERGEDFLEYPGIKLPDSRKAWYDRTIDLKQCKNRCLRNCSCTAFANLDVRDGGSGCILWFGDLIDIREYEENGQTIYVRMAASEIEAFKLSKGNKRLMIIIPITTCGGIFGICLGIFLIMRMKKLNKKGSTQEDLEEQEDNNERGKGDLEVPLFDFQTISIATNNFSLQNKLGQGGFGAVYKGIFENGQEIAVKRLSKKSGQGIDEFKNEVLCISKLQHRNLVKLLGCCIEPHERLVIYEFMPNKSLDSFIFDERQRILLDWPKRFQIINGIARGLLYLHQDSRLRIIHRDLKASNILLNYEMTPKISDFGLARSFGEDEIEANTTRVVGTYGYMSPEYAIDGLFSIKSDVFSFGVLVLEIITGKRNRGFSHPDHKFNLLGHAWKLLNEGRSLELIDEKVRSSSEISQVLRSIQVGLLCVQQCPKDRPDMATAVLMLSSDNVPSLPQPKEPGYFATRIVHHNSDPSSSTNLSPPSNSLSITFPGPR